MRPEREQRTCCQTRSRLFCFILSERRSVFVCALSANWHRRLSSSSPGVSPGDFGMGPISLTTQSGDAQTTHTHYRIFVMLVTDLHGNVATVVTNCNPNVEFKQTYVTVIHLWISVDRKYVRRTCDLMSGVASTCGWARCVVCVLLSRSS